jgi:ABC-type Fe3+-hydroxamate transport system substrate-binding protein
VGVILVDLQRSRLCVGRHGHDRVLPSSIPIVGTQTEIDYEGLIKVHPTIVFTQWGSRDLPARLVELSKTGGWKLIDTTLLSLDDIRKTTIQIDEELCSATGAKAPSDAASHLLARMDAAWAPHEGFSKLGRILLLGAANPPAAFGPGSCHYEILQKLGATPAITTGAPYIQLDSEDILKLAPDGIILIDPRPAGMPPPSAEEAEQRLHTTLAAIASLDIPASKAAHLAIIDDPLGQLPSTAMIGLSEEIAQVLEGWGQRK